MGKYEVLLLLSPPQGRYIEPGEVIELDDDTARILLACGAVKPAEYKPDFQAEELTHGTDNGRDERRSE